MSASLIKSQIIEKKQHVECGFLDGDGMYYIGANQEFKLKIIQDYEYRYDKILYLGTFDEMKLDQDRKKYETFNDKGVLEFVLDCANYGLVALIVIDQNVSSTLIIDNFIFKQKDVKIIMFL